MKGKTYTDAMRKRNEPIFDYECPKCGWNAIMKEGLKEGCCEVIHSQKTATDWGPGFEAHIKCVCPTCNEEFEYFEGSP